MPFAALSTFSKITSKSGHVFTISSQLQCAILSPSSTLIWFFYKKKAFKGRENMHVIGLEGLCGVKKKMGKPKEVMH